MYLSKEFSARCCPSYKKVIDELDEKLAGMKDQKEIRDAIIAFSRRYLTPKEYWNRWFEHSQYDKDDSFRKTVKHAFFHLHYDKEKWDRLRYYLDVYHDKYVKLIDYQYKSFDAGEREVGYPHDNLEYCFRDFEELASSIPSKKVIKRYEEVKDLYLKIKAAEDNVDEWFKLLLEAKDVDFVKDNVEFRLGKDYFDVQLWKLYIGFLKNNGEYKRLIQTYSKYCRFFLDDREMLEKYKNDTSKYGPINLPWHNHYEFEVQNGVEEAEEISVKPEAVLPFDSSICSRFYATYFLQYFSLPEPVILYMLNNANDRVLRQLHSSCKYFFVKKPMPICYRLKTGPEAGFDNEMLNLVNSANPNLYLKNAYVTGSIDFDLNELNTSFISSLISRLYSCKAKYIRIGDQQLSFDELKFFIQHGGVIVLALNCEVKDANGDYVDLEKIMALLPNIREFFINGIKVNKNTGHALSNMKFNAKLSYFGINGVCGEPFDAIEFLKYCIANRGAEHLYMLFEFNEEFDADFVEDFKEILSDYTKSNENVSFSLRHGDF